MFWEKMKVLYIYFEHGDQNAGVKYSQYYNFSLGVRHV